MDKYIVGPLHIVHSEASSCWGGQELRVLTEIQGIIKKGHRVSLLCDERSYVSKEAIKRNINVFHFPLAKRRLKTVIALRKWLRHNKADVINTHGSKDSWLMALAARTLRDSPPIVRSRHVSSPVKNDFCHRWLYTKAAQHIVTTGESIKKHMIDYNGFAGSNITSIPTGIDADVFVSSSDQISIREKLNLPLDKVIIGIVAKLRGEKGHKYLLSAFSAMADPNCHLLIVGGGGLRDNVTSDIAVQIKALKLTEQVTMVGYQAKVVPYMQAMDLFVLPTFSAEGVPQSIIQAMMCELPVISTTVGCINEAVAHEKTGLLIPPQDVTALTQAIKMLVQDKTLQRQFGKAGRERAVSRFCFHKMIDAMEGVFYKVAAANNSR